MATDARDWAASPPDAWLYGIVLGWNGMAMAEVAARHGWTAADRGRLVGYHREYVRARGLVRAFKEEIPGWPTKEDEG